MSTTAEENLYVVRVHSCAVGGDPSPFLGLPVFQTARHRAGTESQVTLLGFPGSGYSSLMYAKILEFRIIVVGWSPGYRTSPLNGSHGA